VFALSDDTDAALELLAVPPLTLPRPVRRANCLARRSCSLRMRLVTSSSSPSFLKPQSLLRPVEREMRNMSMRSVSNECVWRMPSSTFRFAS